MAKFYKEITVTGASELENHLSQNSIHNSFSIQFQFYYTAELFSVHNFYPFPCIFPHSNHWQNNSDQGTYNIKIKLIQENPSLSSVSQTSIQKNLWRPLIFFNQKESVCPMTDKNSTSWKQNCNKTKYFSPKLQISWDPISEHHYIQVFSLQKHHHEIHISLGAG